MLNSLRLQHKTCPNNNRVVIIGTGAVGASTAFAIMIQGIASEIILIDANKERAEGEALDLAHGTSFVPEVTVKAGNYADCATARVVAICAGISQKPGQTRLELVDTNSKIVTEIVHNIRKYTSDAIILMVTNPLDVLTYIAFRESHLPSHQVFGTGTALDSSRFRYFLSEEFGIATESMGAYLVGEHGDSQVPVYSHCNIMGEHISKLPHYSKDKVERAYLSTKNAAANLIAKKGHSYYGVALATARIIRSILFDENHVYPVSVFMQGQYGLRDVYLSLPAIVGKTGIKKILEIDLSQREKNELKESAHIIRETIRKTLN